MTLFPVLFEAYLGMVPADPAPTQRSTSPREVLLPGVLPAAAVSRAGGVATRSHSLLRPLPEKARGDKPSEGYFAPPFGKGGWGDKRSRRETRSIFLGPGRVAIYLPPLLEEGGGGKA